MHDAVKGKWWYAQTSGWEEDTTGLRR